MSLYDMTSRQASLYQLPAQYQCSRIRPTYSCPETFNYTRGSIEGFWSQEGFDEETGCAIDIWGFLFVLEYYL